MNPPTGTSTDPSAGFPEAAFQHLFALEDGHFWFQSRNRLIVWALAHYFPNVGSLLEIGCGTGVVLKAIRTEFPETQLVGADLSEDAIAIARQRVAAEFVQFDAVRVPFRDEFDVVCAFDVLEHIDDDQAALNELAAAVRTGGGVLIMVPQHKWLWSAADEYGHHRRRYTKKEIESKVRSAGLAIVRSTGWMGTLLPIMALSRFHDRRANGAYDPTRELRLSAWLNRSFEVVLDLERAGIQRGLTLPFGGSRLVVARKP